MKNSNLLLLILILFFAITKTNAQHKIKVKVNHLKNDTVIIGHHFNDQLIPDDTLVLRNGQGTFAGKKAYPGGMYFLFLPNKRYFDFLLDADQHFEIQTDTSDFLSKVKYIGSAENTLFINYQNFHYKKGEEAKLISNKIEKNKGNANKVASLKKQYQDINTEIITYFNNVISNNKGVFFADFLEATKPVDVPKTITDKKKQYEYYKTHYFDNFKISDARLLRTPIYENKIDMYLDKVVLQHPDSLNKECDFLIEKSRGNDELFRYMLIHLFNKYASSQLMTAENVYVHLAKKYYIKEAKWSSPDFISELKNKIARKEKCLIGEKSPNIKFESLPNDSNSINAYKKKNTAMKKTGLALTNKDSTILYNEKAKLLSSYYENFNDPGEIANIKAKYTIIWFWTPDCSHCRKDTPLFYELYLKELKALGVHVQTIYLSKDITDWAVFCDDNDKWMNFIKENKFYKNGWNNSWAPFDNFRANFDISSSPVLYLLDENKKIIAKRIGYEQAAEIIKELEKAK